MPPPPAGRSGSRSPLGQSSWTCPLRRGTHGIPPRRAWPPPPQPWAAARPTRHAAPQAGAPPSASPRPAPPGLSLRGRDLSVLTGPAAANGQRGRGVGGTLAAPPPRRYKVRCRRCCASAGAERSEGGNEQAGWLGAAALPGWVTPSPERISSGSTRTSLTPTAARRSWVRRGRGDGAASWGGGETQTPQNGRPGRGAPRGRRRGRGSASHHQPLTATAAKPGRARPA